MNENNDGGFVLPHLSETDARQPLFTFSVPHGLLMGGITKTEYGFVMFSSSFWIEMLVVVLFMLAIAACVGLVLYHTVIKPKQAGTLQGYIIGWGFILPFWATFSFLFTAIVDVRNSLFKFMIGAITIVCFFRTTECIYGFAPDHVTRSAKDFCFYYATIPVVARVQKEGISKQSQKGNDCGAKIDDCTQITGQQIGDPIPCTLSRTMAHLGAFIGLLFLTGALQSILIPYEDLAVFGTGYEDDEKLGSWYGTERYFAWQLYANSALQALFFQMYLTSYFGALVFAFTLLTGYESEAVMDNPLLESQSPSDFWGRRWNLLVHTVLKNGVYKPVRSIPSSRTTAILTTFISSGIFHEWILLTVFASGNGGSENSFRPIYGSATVFFVWQAVLIGLELTLGKSKFFKTISSTLPRPLKTALVVGMGVPPAHFFLEPYVRSDFFIHGAPAFPMIIPIH